MLALSSPAFATSSSEHFNRADSAGLNANWSIQFGADSIQIVSTTVERACSRAAKKCKSRDLSARESPCPSSEAFWVRLASTIATSGRCHQMARRSSVVHYRTAPDNV